MGGMSLSDINVNDCIMCSLTPKHHLLYIYCLHFTYMLHLNIIIICFQSCLNSAKLCACSNSMEFCQGDRLQV